MPAPLEVLAAIELSKCFKKGLEAAIKDLQSRLPDPLLESVTRYISLSSRETVSMCRRWSGGTERVADLVHPLYGMFAQQSVKKSEEGQRGRLLR